MLLSIEELEQEGEEVAPADTPPEMNRDAEDDYHDAVFHSLELRREDLEKMKGEDGEI